MSTSETPTEPQPAETTPAPTAPAPKTRPRRIGRFAIGVNVLLQTLLVVALIGFVNWLGFRHFKRWDFSRNQKFALSSQTKNVLSHLDGNARAIIFFPQAQMLYGDAAALLREYEYASNKKFVVEQVDPYRNLIRARELAEKYKFGASDNIVILDYKGKNKFVKAEEMAEVDNSGMMYGQPPTVKAFKGEEAITTALMELSEEKQNKLLMVGGHGEPTLQDPQIAVFQDALKKQNIKVDVVNLNNVEAVPADAMGVMILGPKADFSDREINLLNTFWQERKGRIFVMLNPGAKTQRLADWLSTQGITPRGDRVLKTGTGLVMDENNQPAMRKVVMLSPSATFVPSGKAITKDLSSLDTQLLGATESLLLDNSKAQTDKIRLTPLLEAGEGFWGSNTFVAGDNRQVFFDPKKDNQGPLTLAVAAEKGALDDPRVKVDTARMVVVGNAGFLTTEGVRMSDLGVDFALNALNWMFNREEIAGIAPRPKQPVKLSLNEKQMNNLALIILIGIPAFVGLIGLIVWTQRRA